MFFRELLCNTVVVMVVCWIRYFSDFYFKCRFVNWIVIVVRVAEVGEVGLYFSFVVFI